ncbi:hypothetical protein D3C85_1566200 [compost metagenome]
MMPPAGALSIWSARLAASSSVSAATRSWALAGSMPRRSISPRTLSRASTAASRAWPESGVVVAARRATSSVLTMAAWADCSRLTLSMEQQTTRASVRWKRFMMCSSCRI